MKFIVDSNIPFIENRLEPFGEVHYIDTVTAKNSDVADADCLVIRTRTHCGEQMLKDSKVKMVVTASIGMDHIDSDWCESNGICVKNAPGCNAPGVALYVWAALLRQGFDPKRHTLGIVGYGHVGSIVAEWGRRMGCNIIIIDPPKAAQGLAGTSTLTDLLQRSDAVTLHVPLTHTGEYATHHLIGKTQFDAMRQGATLINAARGGVVDESEWIRNVEEGRVRAVVDTWEGEPVVNSRLLEIADIVSPHIAGYSLQGKQRATALSLKAVSQFFNIPIDLSDLEGEYRPIPNSLSEEDVINTIRRAGVLQLPERKDLEKQQDFERVRAAYPLHKEPYFG